MNAISGHGRSRKQNLLAHGSERVFLCRSAAEKFHQLRSRGTQRLAVRIKVRLAFSLAPALSGQERVSAREWWELPFDATTNFSLLGCVVEDVFGGRVAAKKVDMALD